MKPHDMNTGDDEAERFASLDPDQCQLCLAIGPDKRRLIIDCLYAIKEAVPEAIHLEKCPEPSLTQRGYYLRICKACRARLLTHLRDWRGQCLSQRSTPKDDDGNALSDADHNIPVRINGAIQWLTSEEWDQHCIDRGQTGLQPFTIKRF